MSSVQESHYIYVDSDLAVSGVNENFTYNITLPPNSQFDRVVVLNALIPKSYYTIQAGANTMILTEKGVDTTITIVPGCYILSAFTNTIGALLTTNSPNNYTYTITFPNTATSPNTGKFTYNVAGNGGNQPSLKFTNFCYEQFGFKENSINTFVGNSLTSSNVIKLQQEDRIFIQSDLVDGSPMQLSVLCDINAMNSPDFSSISYYCPSPEFYSKKFRSNSASTYHFSLTDEHGNLLSTNGLNINFTLLFWKREDVYERLKNMMRLMVTNDKKSENKS